MSVLQLPSLSPKLKNGVPENKTEVEMMKSKLPVLKKLGLELKGANQVRQLTFFRTGASEEGEPADLETEILEAILSDCDTTEDAIMHAVKWSEPEIIDHQLQVSRQIDAEGLVRAFQSALIVGTENKQAQIVVKTLIEYNADARLVRFNRLFGKDCPDPHDTVKHFRNQERAVKARSRRFSLTRMSKVGVGGSGSGGAASDEETDGFKLLSYYLQEMGYEVNLTYRKRMLEQANKRKAAANMYEPARRMRSDNIVQPNWNDLMMWAVVVGQPELAKLLWAKVRSPMRSAIMAARMNASIELRLGADDLNAEELALRTDLYEKWASGVLDEVKDRNEAITLLTLVPRKRNANDDGLLLVWADSVMDQACNDESPCKNFVARTNCQVLLSRYFHGDYASSRCKIPKEASPVMLYLQMLTSGLTLLTGMLLYPLMPTFPFVPVSPVDQFEDDEDDDDDDSDDEAWDLEYFHRPELSKITGAFNIFKDAKLLLSMWYIPRVKFYMHTLLYLVYMGLYWVVICGPSFGFLPVTSWEWTWRNGYMDPYLPDRFEPNIVLEGMLWWYASRPACYRIRDHRPSLPS